MSPARPAEGLPREAFEKRKAPTKPRPLRAATTEGLERPRDLYNQPSSFAERKLSAQIMTWSNTKIPTSSPAFRKRSVTVRSSALGVGSPLGWLCARIAEAAPAAMAGRNTSRGCTRLALIVPREMVSQHASGVLAGGFARWRVSSKRATNSSTVSSRKTGRRSLATSFGALIWVASTCLPRPR